MSVPLVFLKRLEERAQGIHGLLARVGAHKRAGRFDPLLFLDSDALPKFCEFGIQGGPSAATDFCCAGSCATNCCNFW
jgi:hypothetical protein